jgi:hypothetical protein
MAVTRQTTITTADGPITVARIDGSWIRLTVNGHPLELTADEAHTLATALTRAVT